MATVLNIAWHLIREVNPQALAVTRGEYTLDRIALRVGKRFFRGEKSNRLPTHDCCGTCKIFSIILVGQ